jgi:phenylpyruvate tautomerase PptA (4-oxalocrotonate tautomerase family)
MTLTSRVERWDSLESSPRGHPERELKSKALAEVTKNLRDAMGTEDDDDSSGIFAIHEEVPAGHWANGGKILALSELLKRNESTVRRSSCTEGALWHSGGVTSDVIDLILRMDP